MPLDIFEAFYISREAEGHTPATVAHYRWSLGKFAAWLSENGHSINPDEWNATLARAYMVALRGMAKADGTPLSATSVNTYARAFRAFANWCFEEEYTATNIMARTKPPAAPKLVKTPLLEADFQALIQAAKGSRNPYRDVAILLMLFDSGIRNNELCGLNSSDINWPQRLARVWGKGSKERQVAFGPATAQALQKYAIKERDSEQAAFFQSAKGGHLTTSGLRQIISRLGVVAGVDCSPHLFRHSFALAFLRNGANVFDLQRQLGHTTLSMSQRYLAFQTEDLQAAHAKASPVARLGKR